MQLVKDARLLLLLTEVMKIAMLTSLLLHVPCQSSPRPRLRHGRRLALLFHLNQTRIVYTLFSALSLALLPPLLISYIVLLSGSRLWYMPLTLDLTFLFHGQRLCVAEPEATSLSSAVLHAWRSLTRPSALLSPPLNFLQLLSTIPPSTATGPDKVAYHMLKHLSYSGMDFLLHIFNLSWSSHSFPSI